MGIIPEVGIRHVYGNEASLKQDYDRDLRFECVQSDRNP